MTVRRRRRSFLTVDTRLWDDDALWELPVKERRRVKSAMMWGRPLRPRLARAAVQHAPMMQTQAWYGYWLIVVGLLFTVPAGLTAGSSGPLIKVVAIVLGVDAVRWFVLGAGWLRAVARARRAARTGQWPERPERPGGDGGPRPG